jgi:hypothetical protein
MMKLFKQFLLSKSQEDSNPSEKIQSFTYYIPGPPERRHGYREKQFDNLFTKFINNGYEIISYQTVPHSGVTQSGMWVVCLLKQRDPSQEPKSFDDIELELENELREISRHKNDIGIYSLED